MLVCNECSGQNVQIQAWIDPNTDEVKDEIQNEPWCEDCQDHVSLKDKEKK